MDDPLSFVFPDLTELIERLSIWSISESFAFTYFELLSAFEISVASSDSRIDETIQLKNTPKNLLNLNFNEESWVEIYSADPSDYFQVVYKLFNENEKINFLFLLIYVNEVFDAIAIALKLS